MFDDRAHASAAVRPATLPPLARIGEGLLQRAIGDADALQADGEPRAVHHHEHRGEAAVLLADQPADGAVPVAIDHHAGRRGVNAELVLDSRAAHVVARAGRAVRPDQELRRQKQREAARAGRRVGQARQHEMDDVVGHVVFAVGDEYLLAEDSIAPVRPAFGARLHRAEVRAGLRLGQVHRAGPFSGDQLAEIDAAQVIAAVGGKRADRAFAEQRTERKAHRRAVPQFGAGGVDGVRQAHAAIFRRPRDARPAARRPCAIGLAKARRRRDVAIFVARAAQIADPVERRDHIGGEPPGFRDHRGGGRRVEFAEQPLADRLVEAGDMGQRKQDVGDGRAIGHGRFLDPAVRPSFRAGLTRQLRLR